MPDLTEKGAELLRDYNDFPDLYQFKNFAHNIAIHAEERKGGQTGGKVAGQIDNRHVFDTTFREALEVYSAGIVSDLTPQAQPWLELEPQSFTPSVESISAYNEASDRIRTRLGQSNFYSGFHESVTGGGMFGTMCLAMVPAKGKVFNFQEVPFGSFRFRETVDGDPDVVYHDWKPMSADQILKHFKDDPLADIPDFIYENKGNHSTKFSIVHLVQPRAGVDPSNINPTANELERPYESIYFFAGGEEASASGAGGTILREGGMYYQPYVVARVLKSRHDAPWGRSPGTQIYPTTKMLNRAIRDVGVGVEKEVRPPILSPNGSTLVQDDRAGGKMYFDLHQPNSKPEPFKVNPNLSYVEWFVTRLESQIKSAFFNDMFKFFTQQSVATTEKTAFEAQLQAEEQLKLFTPIFTNISGEMLNKVIQNAFTELFIRGDFNDLDFGEENFQVTYNSRIAIAVRAQRTSGAFKLAQMAQTVEVFAQGAGSRVADWEGILADAAVDSSVAANRINSDKTISQLKQKDEQIQELTTILEQLQTAATAAQQGGLTQ
jgi:hypothetical protein